MFVALLCLHFVVRVLSEVPPAPPESVHVEKWLMTWSPATEERNLTYTVQYSRSDSDKWKNVPSCVRTSSTECDVASIKGEDKHGCVMLRVRAERRGLKSAPVPACSRHGDSCTPEVRLSPRPGSLTVHLTDNHSLAMEHGDHAKYRVYYGKEGEPLGDVYRDGVSSVSIPELQVGQRYCVKVQYTVYNVPEGLPSCPYCELIPESKGNSTQTGIIAAAVFILVLAVLTPVMAYVLMYRCKGIKKWLRGPRYHIPEFLLEQFPEDRPITTSSPSEEHYDIISCIAPRPPAPPRRPVTDLAFGGSLEQRAIESF